MKVDPFFCAAIVEGSSPPQAAYSPAGTPAGTGPRAVFFARGPARAGVVGCGRVLFDAERRRNAVIERGWRTSAADRPASAAEIIQGAEPFLEHGAFTVLIDHEEIEIQAEAARDVLGEVLEVLGRERVAFEITSTKEAAMTWYSDLMNYLEMFGADCNLTNIMPSQVMFVDPLRFGERPASLLFNRYPELNAVRNK